MRYRALSYWFDSLDSPPEPRPSLPGDLQVDVAVLGAGFTGLWTAYYLRLANPDCRVAVIERETAGFGASGRNGGWCAPMLQGLESFHESGSTWIRQSAPAGGGSSRSSRTKDALRSTVISSIAVAADGTVRSATNASASHSLLRTRSAEA